MKMGPEDPPYHITLSSFPFKNFVQTPSTDEIRKQSNHNEEIFHSPSCMKTEPPSIHLLNPLYYFQINFIFLAIRRNSIR